MAMVASQVSGYRVKSTTDQSTRNLLDACHYLGVLYATTVGDELEYIFPSKVHQRYYLNPRLGNIY